MPASRYISIAAAVLAAVLCAAIRRPSACCVILAVCALVLLAVNIISGIRLKRRMTALTDYMTAVQDDLTLPDIRQSEEGELGILQSEVYKVVALLREKYSAEKGQKLYMSDMLSDISHQIKTPLTAIGLMTELLEQPGLADEKRLEYAEKIDSQVTRITWLIRNLLTLSQLEAGVLTMKRERIDFDEISQRMNEPLGIMAEVRGVELTFVKDGDVTLFCDRHWFSEAVMNIIKNCIEHTPAGGYVKVKAESNSIYTQLTIRDNGSGIAEKDLPHIFERFYKAENSSAQSVGIGLALAKQIIGAHDGTVEAVSRKGDGTLFTIKLYRTSE